MPQQNAIDKFFSQLLEERKKELGLFLVGVIFAGGILLSFLLLRGGSKGEVQVIDNTEVLGEVTTEEGSPVTPVLIKVDVAGAVNTPGVCELEGGGRVQDAIDGAGGFSDQSDSDWIAKNINLAQKVNDGEKIYIPTKEELEEQSAQSAGQSNSSASSAQSAPSSAPQITGKININTAGQAELESLPGIGPVYAQRIIESRPFGSIEEITRVKGIGDKTLEKLKDLICVE